MKILAINFLARKAPVFILPMLTTLLLGGCVLPASWNPMRPRVVSTENRMPPHESWCYKTLAEADCYPTPQNVPADRLINVEPQSRYPLSAEEYRKTVGELKETP